MQSIIKPLLFLCLFLPSAFCQTEAKPWDYYRTILSTGMFPRPPKVVDTIMVTKAPVAPVDRWELDYKVHMIYRHIESGATIVGVQNIKGAAPSFNLRVGEQHDSEGVRVLDVDWEGKVSVVTLEKNDRAVEFEVQNAMGAPKAKSLPVPRSPRFAPGNVPRPRPVTR